MSLLPSAGAAGRLRTKWAPESASIAVRLAAVAARAVEEIGGEPSYAMIGDIKPLEEAQRPLPADDRRGEILTQHPAGPLGSGDAWAHISEQVLGMERYCDARAVDLAHPGQDGRRLLSDSGMLPLMSLRRSSSPDGDDRPRRIPLSHRRALVAHHTRLRRVAGIPEVRLHVAAEVGPVWRSTEVALGLSSAPIPFWAFPWAGGLALGRFILDHPEEVRGRRVLDFATGSGLVAIAAVRAGARAVTAADIDPYAEAAVGLNARANSVRLNFVGRDLLDEEPPDVDVLLAADTWYEGPLAERVLPWLRAAAGRGIRVLIGDPGRRFLPAEGLVLVAAYDVETTTQLEDRAVLRGKVFTLANDGPGAQLGTPEGS